MRVCRNVYSLLFIPYMYICITRIEDRFFTAALIQGRTIRYALLCVTTFWLCPVFKFSVCKFELIPYLYIDIIQIDY